MTSTKTKTFEIGGWRVSADILSFTKMNYAISLSKLFDNLISEIYSMISKSDYEYELLNFMKAIIILLKQNDMMPASVLPSIEQWYEEEETTFVKENLCAGFIRIMREQSDAELFKPVLYIGRLITEEDFASFTKNIFVNPLSELEEAWNKIPGRLINGKKVSYSVYDLINDPVICSMPELIHGCWLKHGLNVIVGNPNEGKSTLLRYICYEQAKQGKKILWISSDNESHPIADWKVMFAGDKIRNLEQVDLHTLETEQDDRVDEIQSLYDDYKPDIVVHDSFDSHIEYFHGQIQQYDRGKLKAAVNQLHRFGYKYGTTTFILHHPNKKGESAGSNTLVAASDVFCHLKRKNETSNIVCISYSKFRFLSPDKKPISVDYECNPNDNYHFDKPKVKQQEPTVAFTQIEYAIFTCIGFKKPIGKKDIMENTDATLQQMKTFSDKFKPDKHGRTKSATWEFSQERFEEIEKQYNKPFATESKN